MKHPTHFQNVWHGHIDHRSISRSFKRHALPLYRQVEELHRATRRHAATMQFDLIVYNRLYRYINLLLYLQYVVDVAYLVVIVRPWTEIKPASLLVEREVSDIDRTWYFVWGRRSPLHLASLIHLSFSSIGRLVSPISTTHAVTKNGQVIEWRYTASTPSEMILTLCVVCSCRPPGGLWCKLWRMLLYKRVLSK